MARYKIIRSKAFIKDYKKLSVNLKDATDSVLSKLEGGENLEPKYKDHALKGDLNGLRDCHIKPDLVLIYAKDDKMLVLSALRVGSHSNLGI